MIAIDNSIVITEAKKLKPLINKKIKKAKDKLVNLLHDKNSLSKDHQDYINKLIADLPKLVYYNITKLKSLKKEWAIPADSYTKKPWTIGTKMSTFKDDIIDALDYETLRSELYPKYFQSIGIKSCIYCNSQLAVTVEAKAKVKVKAKFQLDHFIPQADFPCFCISFFNLYPSCNSCNNSKSKKPLEFELYTLDKSKILRSDFKFHLDWDSIIKYFVSRDSNDLQIQFKEDDTGIVGPFQTMFDIEGIYNTQKDLAEELIWKAEIYTPAYKTDLINNFPDLFNDASLSDRFIAGNYMEEVNLHKRPMSKFTQDIAKQIGLIATKKGK